MFYNGGGVNEVGLCGKGQIGTKFTHHLPLMITYDL